MHIRATAVTLQHIVDSATEADSPPVVFYIGDFCVSVRSPTYCMQIDSRMCTCCACLADPCCITMRWLDVHFCHDQKAYASL